jgi:hypothetical protein
MPVQTYGWAIALRGVRCCMNNATHTPRTDATSTKHAASTARPLRVSIGPRRATGVYDAVAHLDADDDVANTKFAWAGR